MSNLKKRAPLEDLIFQSSSPVTYKENGQDGGKKILLHALGLSLKNSAGFWVVVVVVVVDGFTTAYKRTFVT